MRRPKENPEVGGTDLVPPELVEACKAGDQQAWASLVRATHREVYTLCLRILGDPDDAAEATQDAYLKAWRGLAGFRGDSKFGTWLYRVAANAAISRQRSRKRRRTHESGADQAALERIPAGDSTESAASSRLDLDALEQELARLPGQYREPILLRDVYGLSIAEIAARLGCSETAAKVRLHRARKHLKEAMEDRSER